MKRVGMFVWNHFTNDARVLRIGSTLSHDEYIVHLFCIADPTNQHLKRYEKINSYFEVFRLRRFPLVLTFLETGMTFLVQRKGWAIVYLAVWLFLMYWHPIIILFISLCFVLMLKTQMKVFIIRVSLIGRMIVKGYRGHYDIYHAHDLNTLLQAYVCAKWRFRKRPLIYDSHEVQTSRTGYNSRFYYYFESFLIKRTDCMIVENHTRAQYNEALYGFYPYVVHNYPSIQLQNKTRIVNLHQQLELPIDEKILLYQGGIQVGRGLEQLIEAAEHFVAGTLVFIGDGRLKPQLEEMVRVRQLGNKVRFISKVPVTMLLSYTRQAYLGFQVLNNVCFNHWSASSNKLFEYIMSEVPVVACQFPEIKRVIVQENVGVLVDSHCPLDIARGVNELLQNKQLYNDLKKNCQKARLTFNWEREERHLLDVYDSFNEPLCLKGECD